MEIVIALHGIGSTGERQTANITGQAID